MSSYRPRPIESKQCKYCGIPFESRHKKTIYCGESCRQQAYQARQQVNKKASKKPSEDLPFSLQNIGVAATGAAVAAAGNYLFNDRPAQQAILDKLSNMQQQLDQLTKAVNLMTSYIQWQAKADPTLAASLEEVQRVHRKDQWDLKPMSLDDFSDSLGKKKTKGAR